MNDKQIEEIHKMAQIALGKQVTMECTKFAIEEGFFDNLIALYNAGYCKIDEGSVVLTEEQFNEFRQTIITQSQEYTKLCDEINDKIIKARKQAVKEVLEKTKEKCKELEDKFSHLCKSKKECLMETCRYEGVLAVKRELNEIAKEMGV